VGAEMDRDTYFSHGTTNTILKHGADIHLKSLVWNSVGILATKQSDASAEILDMRHSFAFIAILTHHEFWSNLIAESGLILSPNSDYS
jgi:hypothetical protein